MSPDDPRHGTTRGHAAGCREICCREARNSDERRRRKYRDVLGIERRIDGTGTRRRIQALWALGWTSRQIAAECGWGTPQAVTEVVGVRHSVFLPTAEAIHDAYERMSGTPGPSAKNRREAEHKGWAPPLAWEGIDIDDPTAEPWRPEPKVTIGRPSIIPALVEDFEWLVSQGESEHRAAVRLGINRMDSFQDQRRRHKKEAS